MAVDDVPKVTAIRGATSVDRDEASHVAERVCELFRRLLAVNEIERIIAVTFSVTPDIRSANPATAIREAFPGYGLALMCFQEAIFADSPAKIIRVMLLCESKSRNFVYLHAASSLRADLHQEVRQ